MSSKKKKKSSAAVFELRRGDYVLETFPSLTKFAQFVLDKPSYLHVNSYANVGAAHPQDLTLHQVERSDIHIAGAGKGTKVSDGSFIPGCQIGS